MLILNAVECKDINTLANVVSLYRQDTDYGTVITDEVNLDVMLPIEGVSSYYTKTLTSMVMLSSLYESSEVMLIVTNCDNIIGPTWAQLISENPTVVIDK